ncbi:MAG: hypothetical protein GY850_32570, partial [bacterium]|nr:hypothetical protein [bacterium]
HVMSRTALQGYPMGAAENDYLFDLIKRYSQVYFAEIIGHCLMGNHFHLLVRMHPGANYSNDEIKKRFALYYGPDQVIETADEIHFYRKKWASLSEFMKDIKQRFSRFYNNMHNRRGYFWGDRFKSLIVENGQALIDCLAYIDLNPIRAGIAQRPEEYRWSSIGYHAQTGNRGGFLSLDLGLREFGGLDEKECFRRYRKYVYETGAVDTEKGAGVDKKILEKERKKNFKLTRTDRFKLRTRYFSDSGIIGSKEFVRRTHQRFKHTFQSKDDRKPNPIPGLKGFYSLKKLIE